MKNESGDCVCSHAFVCVNSVCDPQRFGCVDHDLQYKHGVHNVWSAPVICPLNPTAVCTVSMYCKRGNSN